MRERLGFKSNQRDEALPRLVPHPKSFSDSV